VFIVFAISTSVKVTQQLFQNEEKRKEIEQERTKSELAYLKSQINPHFLFNTLNSIYSIANKESKRTAKAIVKLSGLMRYVLYESDNELVPLSNEISYIQDYIELQKLRIFNNVKVSFELEGDFENCFIEPLLLIPIVENAFKHGVDSTTNSHINIVMKAEGREFSLHVDNTIIEGGTTEKTGIGLNNLKKRLEMLYANDHILLIDNNNKTFNVKLMLKLKSVDEMMLKHK
jgi:sensor histidine kinase YesM